MGSSTQRIVPVDSGTFTDCMEQLQESYVAAVAATAGCIYERQDRDRHGFDAHLIRPSMPGIEEVSLYAQLKCTTTIKPNPARAQFSYRFEKREYLQRLAGRRDTVKGILIVMSTDPVQAQWTTGTHEQLSVVNCCYWAHLEGHSVPAAPKPYVRIPTANRFDAEALNGLLDRAQKGQPL